jgi:peptidoglycan/xylan/chitin deacetylase (PgdA/CDA1 family)
MRRVTLTFDNGPTPGVTERVLEHLDRAGLRCTFFVIGRKLVDPAAAALMRQAHEAGHWIGNHTLTHSVAFGDRPDAAYARLEIGETQARLGALVRPEKLFRPYGNSGQIGPHLLSRAATEYLLAERYCTLIWNSVPGDWKDPDGWVDRCVEQVSAQDWAVTVLHDIAEGCLPRLPELLRRLQDMGVIFEQNFPDSVILTRGGRIANLDPAYIADGPVRRE